MNKSNRGNNKNESYPQTSNYFESDMYRHVGGGGGGNGDEKTKWSATNDHGPASSTSFINTSP